MFFRKDCGTRYPIDGHSIFNGVCYGPTAFRFLVISRMLHALRSWTRVEIEISCLSNNLVRVVTYHTVSSMLL